MPWAIWINNHAMELSNSTINNIRWDPPSMAQHPESMVEIHPRPTTPAFTGSKDIEHLRGSLAIRPLRNITGPTRKGASSSGNLSEKVSHGRDNRGFDSRDPFAAQAHPNSIIHGELHLGVSHEADASAIAGTCHHPSRESSDAQRGIEAGVMEMDDIQEGLCPGIAGEILRTLPYDGIHTTDSIGYAGGIWLLWRRDMDVLTATEQEIHAIVKGHTPSFPAGPAQPLLQRGQPSS
ncbi:uncharacterized protein LOC142629285 isoform X1 [Castanea sativa]|uniref:uncharacterized protein LOC142629285 isoform X1 n=1 Tax=Castanea sativa TaxID=21020 RepID=UPI003F6526E1